MNDETLKTLLSAYAAPTSDNGFSDQLMDRLQTEEVPQTVDLSDYGPAQKSRWRGWLVTLLLGFMAGLLWNRLSITLPELPGFPDIDGISSLRDIDWALYGALALCFTGSLLFLEINAS